MIRIQVAVVLGLFAVGALATQPDAAKPTFESLDKNSDGKVSLNEAAENDALFVAFKSLDTNKDGVLSREEFAAYQRDKPTA
jgi:Ca2+-binding EF-hand superfamily protein